MRRFAAFRCFVLFLAALFLAAPAGAADLKVATVDFQRALNEVNEGKTAMARLEGMRDEKMKTLERKKQALIQLQTEIQNQAAILSESARAEKEQAFMAAQAELQQLAYSSEQEFQQSYMGVLEDLTGKLRETASAMGRDKGYNLILESSQGGVVYAAGLPDLTDELIKQYNTTHGAR